MTTGRDDTRDEYARLMEEVQIAQARELHRLTASSFHCQAPAFTLGAILAFAMGALAALTVVAGDVFLAH